MPASQLDSSLEWNQSDLSAVSAARHYHALSRHYNPHANSGWPCGAEECHHGSTYVSELNSSGHSRASSAACSMSAIYEGVVADPQRMGPLASQYSTNEWCNTLGDCILCRLGSYEAKESPYCQNSQPQYSRETGTEYRTQWQTKCETAPGQNITSLYGTLRVAHTMRGPAAVAGCSDSSESTVHRPAAGLQHYGQRHKQRQLVQSGATNTQNSNNAAEAATKAAYAAPSSTIAAAQSRAPGSRTIGHYMWSVGEPQSQLQQQPTPSATGHQQLTLHHSRYQQQQHKQQQQALEVLEHELQQLRLLGKQLQAAKAAAAPNSAAAGAVAAAILLITVPWNMRWQQKQQC